MKRQTFVIAGASLAGATAASTLRDLGFDGRVVLIGEEPHRPYQRPPLSKAYLRGEAETDAVYVHPESYYDTNDIELRTATTVTSVRPGTSEVVCDDGETLHFDRLLVTTGTRARQLDVPGARLDGIYQLRSLDDSDRLRARLARGGTLVVVGAGWIGTEVAASARTMGLDVTIIDPGDVPLARVLGARVGGIYRDIHMSHGVTLVPETTVERFEGTTEVEAVRTSDGRSIGCDFVVVGIGAVPRTELLDGSGITVDNGAVTDEFLQTDVPGVFAAGDVANARHPVYGRLRIEHWANARSQAAVAARNMLGGAKSDDRVLDHPIPFERVPYFYSDQFDVGMEYSGHATDWDDVVLRGDVEGRRFIAFWLKERRILAAMNVNVWDVTDQLQALIRSRLRVDTDRLADPDTALTDLAPPIGQSG